MACVTVETIGHDIIKTSFIDRYEVKLKDMIDLNQTCEDIANGEKIRLVVDTSNLFQGFSSDIIKYVAKEASMISKVQAMAVIIDSLSLNILAKFFLKFYTPPYPMKTFRNEADAIEWVKRQNSAVKIDLIPA